MKEHGYFRVTTGVPGVKPAGTDKNVKALIALYHKAAAAGADLVVFPELSLTGYTCGDLFAQDRLLKKAEDGLAALAAESKNVPLVVGLPVKARGMLFNCAAFLWDGAVRGIVPKTYLPNSMNFMNSGGSLRRMSW